MHASKCGWSGTWTKFLSTNQQDFIKQLKSFYEQLPWTNGLSHAQENAWRYEHTALITTLNYTLSQVKIDKDSCWIVFEHELTGEAGKRLADANIILPTGDLIVIEFKHKDTVSLTEIDRLNTDLNYISKFHSESIHLDTHAFLAITKPNANLKSKSTDFKLDIIKDGLLKNLAEFLIKIIGSKPHNNYDSQLWLQGQFYRQPSILAGTVKAFFEGEMPNLKGEAQENITAVRAHLAKIYEYSRQHKQRYVVVVNGRPGAGKTLLGVSMTADLIDKYSADVLQPVFLSGNAFLVDVLRYTLNYYGKQSNKTQKFDVEGRSLIEHLKDYRSSMNANNRANAQLENFIIFDEAQRAWGETRRTPDETQLDLFCNWLSQKEHGVLLLLVGDGQAIYNREMPIDKMMQALDKAVAKHSDNMTLIMPRVHQNLIEHSKPIIRDYLYLEKPIRQIYTTYLDEWIEAVLASDDKKARYTAKMMETHYPLYLCRSKLRADQFAKELFKSFNDNENINTAFRMGWLISNKGGHDKGLTEVQRDNAMMMGAWYVDQPTSELSCCQLQSACNEFGCQGLELNIALVNWGKDWLYRDATFAVSSDKRYRREQRFYTEGVYRVLLSRGRNGLMVMADDEQTYQFLAKCGMKTID